jgi:hypothetical protein
MKKNTLQMNLDSFFKTSNQRKQIFYIDWTSENPLATWLLKKPKDLSFSSTVKWTHIGDIVICSKDRQKPENSEYKVKINIINSKSFDENAQLLSFLKSHLQKSIRRQKYLQALKSTKEMLLLDKNAFLRRICIIIFEDVKLKKYFMNFVWLMVACSKGYILEEYHLDFIFKYIYDLCLEKEFDDYNTEEEETILKTAVSKFIDKVNMNKNISEENKDILYCIALRISYGGMGGDLDMLCYYGMQYLHFFEKKGNDVKNIDIDSCKHINAKYVLGLNFENIDDFLYQGVDFHCFPGIIKDIKEDTNYKYSDEQLKKCIWEYNSKINTRKINDVNENELPNIKNIWEDIKQILLKHQKIILGIMLKKIKELNY